MKKNSQRGYAAGQGRPGQTLSLKSGKVASYHRIVYLTPMPLLGGKKLQKIPYVTKVALNGKSREILLLSKVDPEVVSQFWFHLTF